MTHTQTQGADGAGTFTGRPQPLTILYTNWRGETAVRRILIDAIAYGNEALGLAYGRNEWHPEEQWLLSATDADKGERRTFAMAGIKAWGQAAVDAALASPRADSAERTAGEAGEDWAAILAYSILTREGYAYEHLVNAVATELRRIEAVGYSKGHEAGDAHRKAATPAPAATPGVPDSVRARLQQAIDGFESEAADAHDMGERPDLWDDVVEVLISDVRVMLKALATQPAGQSGDSQSFRLAVTEEWLRREGEADAVAECEAGATASAHTRGAVAAGADATVPPHILAMAQAMADGRAPAWENMRHGARVPQHHSRSYWVMLAQDANAALASHPAGQAGDAGAERTAEQQEKIALAQCLERGAAPNSTRTGAAETAKITEADLRDFAKSKGWYVRAGTSVPQIDGGWRHPFSITAESRDLCELINSLAARPEAPSDAGWRDISTAPRNDTLVTLGFWDGIDDPRWIAVSGWYEAGPADRCWYSAYDEDRIEPTHWRPLGALPTPPSDPAPSGQAEG